MKKSILSVFAIAAIAAVPVAASQAKPPAGKGNEAKPPAAGKGNELKPAAGRGEEAKPPAGKRDEPKRAARKGTQRGPGVRSHGRSKRCSKLQRVGFVVEGTFGGYADPDLTVDVVEANRHARGWMAAGGSTFSTAGARVLFDGVTDGDGDGSVTFADVESTDQAIVVGKLRRPKKRCAGDVALAVRRIEIVRP